MDGDATVSHPPSTAERYLSLTCRSYNNEGANLAQ